MDATTRLICAALALLAASGARASSAEARAGLRADSLGAALEATDAALVGRVLGVATHGSGSWADVLVLETLRGPELSERIELRAGPEALLGGAGPLREGETALWLATRAGGALELPAGLRLARIPLANAEERDAASAFLSEYLAAASSDAAPGALDALLRRSVALASPELRRGVLEDLSHRLGPRDAPFLTGLAQRGALPSDVRVFAITGLAGLPRPLPASVAALRGAGTEPVAVRRAVVNAHAAQREWPALEAALDDADAEIRRSAVENLARPESVAALEGRFARETSRPVQLAIVRQLGLIGTEASRKALQRIVATSPDAALRAAAAPWLGAGD